MRCSGKLVADTGCRMGGTDERLLLSEQELMWMFKRQDKDGDGRLDWNDLREAFRCLGARFPGWRAAEALRHADADGDGFIKNEQLLKLTKYALQFEYGI